MSRTSSHETITLSRRPASPGVGVPFAGVSFEHLYQAHFLYHPATLRRPGRVRGARICVNLRHYFLPRVSAPVFSDCHRADTPGQPIFRSPLFKRSWLLRRAIRCGGGSVLRTDRTPSAIHCGVRIHNSKSWLVVDSTSGRSATNRPAAGLRPLHPLISIPDAAHAVTDRIVVRHKMKFSRTPERWTHTASGAGFLSYVASTNLLRVDGVPIKSGQFSLIRHRSIRFITQTSLPC